MEASSSRIEEHTEGIGAVSSVKLTLNAKGDVQIELKIVANEQKEEVERIRMLAADQFVELRKTVGR